VKGGLSSPFGHDHKRIRWFEVAHVAVAVKTRGGGELRAPTVWAQRRVTVLGARTAH
jgi:hypothetical protein